MNEQQRQELIEKRELGTLTPEEYRLYLDLLENDPDFADQLALHQLLVETAHQEADQDLWESITAATNVDEAAPRPSFWFIIVNHPLARRGVFSLLALMVVGIGGYWWYQRSRNRPIATELPVFNVKTRQEGLGAGSENDSIPNRLIPVLLSRSSSDTLDENLTYYAFAPDTLRLYLSRPDLDSLAGWRLRYDAIADTYQLIRPSKPSAPLRLTGKQVVPLP